MATARIPVIVPQSTPQGFVRSRGGDAPQGFGDLRGLTQGVSRAAGDVIQQADRQRFEQARELEEQQRQRAAADKAQAQAQRDAIKDSLADIYEEHAAGIVDGTVDKTTASGVFKEKAKATIEAGLGNVPNEHRQMVQQYLDLQTSRLDRYVGRAVRKRDQSDTASAIEQTLEYTSRAAQADPQGARLQAMQTLQELGPHAGWDSAKIQAKAQKWKEDAAYTQAFGLISSARRSNASLDKAAGAIGKLEDLDPQRKAQLVDRIDAYKFSNDQKAELAAQKAQRQQEAALRRAEAAFKGAQTVLDSGGFLRPEYADTIIKATAGTPYQAAFRQQVEQAKAIGGLALQPPDAVQATLDAIDVEMAKNGKSDALLKRREQVAKVKAAQTLDIERDPLRAYTERGGDAAPPVQTTTFDTLLATLPQRAQHAQTVSAWAKREVSPLLPEEADAVRSQLSSLPPEQAAIQMKRFASVLTPKQMQAVATQIDKTSKPLALAMAYGADEAPGAKRWFRADIPPSAVADLILTGAQAKRDKTVKEDDATEMGARASIARFVGEAVSGKAREDVIEAARYISLGMEAKGQSPDYEKAARIAIGGDLIEHNGRRIPVPNGITEDNIRERLTGPAAKAVAMQSTDGNVYIGGTPVPVDKFVLALPDAQLEPAGRGRYVVRAGTGLVTNAQRRPVVVELSE